MAEPLKKSDKEKAWVSIEPQPLKIGFGLALNIGLTVVSAALYDLKTGQFLTKTSAPNALQQFGGAEFSLIDYAKNEKKALQLTAVLREQVFDLMLEVLKQAEEQTGEMAGSKTGKSWSPQEVHYVAVAGTTLMQHLFAAMDPSGLAETPPRPVSLFGEELPAEPTMYFCPCISAAIGGDITAAMFAEGVPAEETISGRMEEKRFSPNLCEPPEKLRAAALKGAGMALTAAGREKLKKIANEKRINNL